MKQLLAPIRLSLLSPLLAIGSVLGGAHTASAMDTSFQGTYVKVDHSALDPDHVHMHSSNVIYLNGCFDGGCDLIPGEDSSIENLSSIISEAVHIPPFDGGEMQWQAVVDCVKETYGLFDIVITDQDPGQAPHFEAIVAGTASDIGLPDRVGGVAPFECGQVIDNAITFSFANAAPDVDTICWTVAQETAHAFGLDHELLCEDPLTYLQECGPKKSFQDQDAPCGEASPRACSCMGNTQNSFQRIKDHFGLSDPTPPSLVINEPTDGAQVEPGFQILTTATDDMRIVRLTLKINDQEIAEATEEPFTFAVPKDISDGYLQIEITAYDNYNYQTTKGITVLQGQACTPKSGCADDEACVDGRCVVGIKVEGGLGASCAVNEDCVSGRCGVSEEGNFCAEPCSQDKESCPNGFTCQNTGEVSVCWKSETGGCSLAGGNSKNTILWTIVLFAVLATRTRRRHKRQTA